MREVCLLFSLLLFSLAGYNQYVLTALNYSQDFNTLSNTVNSGILPTGWYLSESGINADTEYRAGNGSSITGDTYSFGSIGSTERALGGLRSSALVPQFGFWMTNSTGNTINAIIVSYTGEQWRLGATGRSDRLDFQYSLDATALNNGTWTDLSALDFASPNIAGPIGALDGNLAANRTSVGTVINGLNIPVGGTIFFRWFDFDIPIGSEDGLSIDDLSLVITTAIPASTDHYRTIATGVWSNPSLWETSVTGGDPWVAAIVPPTSAANTITIRNGHTVTIDANTSADQLTIQNGGNLIYSAGIFTIDDGTGDDVNIQNGGIFTLSFLSNLPTFSGAGATVNVSTGGILRLTVGGLTTAAPALSVNSNNFVYQHQSILEWAPPGFGTFSTSDVIYFPNVDAVTIPIFRSSNPVQIAVGGGLGNNTIINGVFECNGNVVWQNAGTKTFRNGIKGTGKVNGTTSGKFIINGLTAELGGPDSLIVPAVDGLEIGSASGTTVTVTSDKVVHGNVTLLATNTYVELGANDLNITGTISGGSATSYVRTDVNGGVLKLNLVGSTAKVFPIGETTYNPLEISFGNDADYSARVRTGIVDPNGAIPTDAVNRTWYIHASTTTPGVTVKYQYSNNGGELTGAAATQPTSMEILQSDFTTWHLSVGNTTIMSTPGPPHTITSAAGLTINNTPVPYTLGVTGTIILSVDCIISCESKKMNNSGVISFNINSCAGVSSFEVQRSVNGDGFETIGIVPSDINRLQYSFTDFSLQKGMNLYRIKVNRASGAIKYSNTTAIINDSKGILLTSLSPNPVHSQAVVTISTAKAGTVHLSIYDMAGRVIKQWQVPAAEGSNRIIMNLDGLQAGVYHLVATGKEAKTSYRFVKQ